MVNKTSEESAGNDTKNSIEDDNDKNSYSITESSNDIKQNNSNIED